MRLSKEEIGRLYGVVRGPVAESRFATMFPGEDPSALAMSWLEEAISHRDARAVELAVAVARRFGLAEGFVDLLVPLLVEPWHYNHEDLVEMLDNAGVVAAVPALIQLTRWVPDYMPDDGRALAVKAMYALHRLGTPEAKAAIRQLRDSEDPRLREAARRFDRYVDDPIIPEAQERQHRSALMSADPLRAVRELYPDSDPPEMGRLWFQRGVERRDGVALEMGLLALAAFGIHRSQVPVLVELLTQHWHREHWEIARILGRLKASEAVPALVWLAGWRPDYLIEEEWMVAFFAIRALADIGTEEAVAALNALRSSDNHVTVAAFREVDRVNRQGQNH